MTLRLAPKAEEPWLLAGAAVDVKLSATVEQKGALVIPRDALVYGAVGQNVVKVVDGKTAPVPVSIVAKGRDAVLAVGDGLAEGDTVVVRGNERLMPGQPITIVPEG